MTYYYTTFKANRHRAGKSGRLSPGSAGGGSGRRSPVGGVMKVVGDSSKRSTRPTMSTSPSVVHTEAVSAAAAAVGAVPPPVEVPAPPQHPVLYARLKEAAQKQKALKLEMEDRNNYEW